MSVMEQSQSVSSVPRSGWLLVSVFGPVKVQPDSCGDTRSLCGNYLSVCCRMSRSGSGAAAEELLKRSGLEPQTTQPSLLGGTRCIWYARRRQQCISKMSQGLDQVVRLLSALTVLY